MALADIVNPAYKAGQEWLRIPRQRPATHASSNAWRTSDYAGVTTMGPVRGFHRTSADAMIGPLVLHDWKEGQRPVEYPGICRDGLMRNGVCDSNHRGIWFYLHFLHPWKPTEEIIVELLVRQSATHNKNKHHMKYCASPDEDAPGEVNPYVDVVAIHLPKRFVPEGLRPR